MPAPVIAGRQVAPALFPLALVAAVAALLAFAPGLVALTPAAGRSAGLIILTIGLWATGALPEHLTALLFFLLPRGEEPAPAALPREGDSRDHCRRQRDCQSQGSQLPDLPSPGRTRHPRRMGHSRGHLLRQ